MTQRQVTLRDIWQIIWKRKLWFILPLIVVTGVAFGGSYLLPVKYESSTVIVITEQKLVSRDLEQMIPTDLADLPDSRTLTRWLASTRAEIMSSGYINKLISDLGLEPSNKVIKGADDLRDRFPEYDVRDIVRKLHIEEIREDIAVNMVGENQVLITCKSDDPKTTVDMATKLAEIYRDRKLADEVVMARESQTFTDQQFSIARREFEDAERELVEFKNNYITTHFDAGITSNTNLNAVESEIDATRLDYKEAADRKNFLARKVADLGVDTTEIFRTEPALTEQLDLALSATREVSKLMSKYLWRDAKIQGQLTKVADALDSLENGAMAVSREKFKDQSVGLQNDIGEMTFHRYKMRFLTGKDEILNEAIEQVKGFIAGSPYYEQTSQRMQKKIDAKRQIFENWQKQAAGINILQATTAAAAESKYRILEPASIPLEPSSPDRVKITLMGLGLGLLLGCGAIVIAEIVDHSIKSIDEIEELLGLEVVGTIPKIEEATQVRKARVA